MKALVRRVALAVAILVSLALPSSASPWWSDRTMAGHDLSNCPQTDELLVPACLTLGCGADGRFTLAVHHDEPGGPASADAAIGFDGVNAFTARFTAPGPSRGDNFWLVTEIPAEVMTALMDRLSTSSALSLRFDARSGLRLAPLDPLPLSGLAEPLARFRNACVNPTLTGRGSAAAPVPANPGATPTTDPARFPVTTSLADTGATADSLARSLLSREIAGAEAGAGRRIEVLPEHIRFADGRQLLITLLCDPTWFGITGCETHVFTASGPNAPFAASVSGMIGGGPYWLDLALGVGGWPDILSEPRTGGGAYARMRWTGARYDICPQGLC